jgi:DNA repair exonuclease SbcCD ATPase subunit
MDKLIERNGRTDILKKTLIIIDEAHKLYGGDLKAAERPNMAVMEQLLQKSYNVSGKDSARLLIMTATPFTNSPLELFQLINLCKETPSEKITTNLKEFKRLYMNADAILTDAGVKKLADKLSGYISYLNREQDPTQFAQPIMIEVPVLMSHISDPAVRKELFTNETKEMRQLNKLEARALAKQEEDHIKDLNRRLRETQKRLKTLLKERQARCKTLKNKAEKAQCLAESQAEVETTVEETIENIKVELERLKKSQSDNKGLKEADKERVKRAKEKLETLRKELLQEVMLAERCKNIKLI